MRISYNSRDFWNHFLVVLSKSLWNGRGYTIVHACKKTPQRVSFAKTETADVISVSRNFTDDSGCAESWVCDGKCICRGMAGVCGAIWQ